MLAVLAGGIAVVALAGGGDDGGDGGALTVERSFVPGTRQPELLVSVKRELNVADTAENGRTVGLECRDSAKRLVINARVEWPFIEEPGYPLAAHPPARNRQGALEHRDLPRDRRQPPAGGPHAAAQQLGGPALRGDGNAVPGAVAAPSHSF